MLRTISIPVDLPQERFFSLMAQCAEIFNAHIDWALEQKTFNKSKAHRDLYSRLRLAYPDVPSALLQATRDNALEAIKQTKFKRKPRKKPTTCGQVLCGLRYDKRTMTIRGEQLTLSCIGKRVKLILAVPDYFREIYDNWDFRGATVTYAKQTKQFWVRLVFEHSDPEKLEHGDVQGIDRGLYHLCSTHDGKFFSSNKIRANQRKYLYNRKQLQQKGTRSAKRRLKSMSGREKRFNRYLIDVSHAITKQLAQQKNVRTFILQNLDGKRTWNQREYIQLPRFEEFLEYKATALGKTVIFLDSRFNPNKCNLCKSRNTKIDNGYVKCHSCKYTNVASLNRAINLRDEYLLNI